MRWRTSGCGKPDFGASLSLFRPELLRVDDGIEHLAFFPMYTPNGSLDIRFEALIVRVPWPAWIADLESTAFDNEKFVPVHLVDNTGGLRQRVRGASSPRPSASVGRGRQHLRRHLLRPRGGALPARCQLSRGRRPGSPSRPTSRRWSRTGP